MRQVGKGLGTVVLAVALIGMAGGAMAELAMVEGMAFYRERMALPQGAVLDVELLDVSRADAPAERLAAIRIKPTGQVPIAFTLHYDPALIDERHSYNVAAALLADGRTIFRSVEAHPVLTRGAGSSVDVLMVMAADEASLVGPTWVAEDIDGGGVIDNLQSSITFAENDRAYGHAGCNNFTGGYELEGEKLTIGLLASTMMACPEAIMNQEAKLHAALGRVQSWRTENGLLHLLDESGAPIIRLWRRE